MNTAPTGNRRPGVATTDRGWLDTEWARWGPDADPQPIPSVAEASAYCRQLARRRQENFTVVSWLLPRELRSHFYHLYAYCRWADDLADESPDPATALVRLDWWEAELDRCLAGTARHPVFVALRETVQTFQWPDSLLRDLLVAFRRDQVQNRYVSWDELFDYCRCSANPVGRLILRLARCADDEADRQSDAICTGLQLANFCQDVRRDAERDRIYLPRESWRRAGCDEAMIRAARDRTELRTLVAEAVDKASEQFALGRPLVARVPRWLRVDLQLFLDGGEAVLHAIRRQRYDVWSRRPVVGRCERIRLGLRAWWTSR